MFPSCRLPILVPSYAVQRAKVGLVASAPKSAWSDEARREPAKFLDRLPGSMGTPHGGVEIEKSEV